MSIRMCFVAQRNRHRKSSLIWMACACGRAVPVPEARFEASEQGRPCERYDTFSGHALLRDTRTTKTILLRSHALVLRENTNDSLLISSPARSWQARLLPITSVVAAQMHMCIIYSQLAAPVLVLAPCFRSSSMHAKFCIPD